MAPRSAKALAKSKLQKIAVEENDEDFFDEDAVDSEVEHPSSNAESDYGASKGKQRASIQAPATKRAKTSSRSAASKKQKPQTTRQKKSLSLLLTMPLDVLFEIFGQLSPKDIIGLARTSKILRETLMSRGALTVWKAARERLDAPEPPSDMSEPGWAALLFGNACQNCGAKNVQNVDFMLRRRLCIACKKGGIFVESRLKKSIPNLDKSILDLIPHTTTGGWAKGYSSKRNRFFWTEDVEKMIQKVATFEEDVRTGCKDARKKYEDFKEERKRLVEDVHSAVRGYEEWVENDHRERQMDKDALIDNRREAIFERFEQLGYEIADIMSLQWEPEFRPPTQLTDRIWHRIRLSLEPKIQERQKLRLEKETRVLKASRRKIVHELYQTYQRSLVSSEWRYLPRTFDICQLEPFAQFVDAPSDITVTPKDFAPGMEMLPELLSSLSEAKRKNFLNMLSTRGEADGNLQSTEVPSSDQVDAVLNLATSVFECRHGHVAHSPRHTIVGLEEIMTHHCDSQIAGLPTFYDVVEEGPSRSFGFSEASAETARALILLVGNDPATASASDMDDKDFRFACRRCKPQRDSFGRWFVNGYSWRRAIAHRLTIHNSGTFVESEVGRWEMLSDSITEELKTKEREDSRWRSPLWTCSHCSFYMTDLQDRAVIIQHLRTQHAIAEPKEPDDLFLFERFDYGFFQRIAYSVADPAEASAALIYRCLRCPSSKTQLFNSDGVITHLKEWHRAPNPQLGLDWIKAVTG